MTKISKNFYKKDNLRKKEPMFLVEISFLEKTVIEAFNIVFAHDMFFVENTMNELSLGVLEAIAKNDKENNPRLVSSACKMVNFLQEIGHTHKDKATLPTFKNQTSK